MCGSNDIVKQDGLFVCQYCGCKYTVEEAKKMMDDAVSVKIDTSETIGNYAALAQNAFDSGNYIDAEKYCNKYMEADLNSHKIWLLKGKTVGIQSTPDNNRLYEALNIFSKAIELSGEEEKEKAISESQLGLVAGVEQLIQKRIELLYPSPNVEICKGFKSDIALVKNLVRDSFIKAHIKTFGIVNTCAAMAINKGILETWYKVFAKYTSPSFVPTVLSYRSFLTEGDLLIDILSQSISLCNPPADDRSSEILFETYDLMIRIQSAMLAPGGARTAYLRNMPIRHEDEVLSPIIAKDYRERIRVWTDLRDKYSKQ